MPIINGWLVLNKVVDKAMRVNSPNFNDRPQSVIVNLLVIHNISLPPNEYDNNYIEQYFLNELPVDDHPYFKTIVDLHVSAHFLIKRNGDTVQFVSCNDRAWHAGVSSFGGNENCNDFSIGIELEGADDTPFDDKQYHCLVNLTQEIMQAYPGICAERIVGHSDISPGRKTDPGECFDWTYYRNKMSDLAKD